ncbi:tat pathway signal sequence [Seiridium cupressi]
MPSPLPRPAGVEKLHFEDDVRSSADIEKQLEPIVHKRFARLRYVILNTYRRLFGLAFIGNLVAFIIVMARDRYLLDCINACAINLLVCGLARQPLVVNALFVSLCAVPRSAPVKLRHLACKIFHLGGVHSGTGIASCVWYIGFLAVYTYQYQPSPVTTAVLVLGYLILVVLMVLIGVSTPKFRMMHHDWFELTHRFSTWIVLVLFWAVLLVLASQEQPSMGQFLVSQPAFWAVIIVTVAIIQPWAMLRRVEVTPEPLSKHAIRLHFSHTPVMFGQGISISKHPLRDWHSFATVTDRFDTPTSKFSCLISKAGDWTSSIISQPVSQVWVRGVPTYGFGYVMRVFSRIIVVTTGSGIGPCLSFIDDDSRPQMRVLWQTKSPLQTYSQRTIDLVHTMDPDPLVIDTNISGRVDMLEDVLRLHKEFKAEAVCVISNPMVTKKLVNDLEKRGVYAYGPIFDS